MKHKFNNLFLIGPMGCGKNTIGKQLAQLSGLPFYDTDQEIERRSGVSINWIFEREKESGFRYREKEIIYSLTKLDHIILATGGGCVTTAENCAALTKNGVVIYLNISLDIQIKRLSMQKSKRPLFLANSSPQQLGALNKIREPLYRELADLTYNSDNTPPRILATQIIDDWKKLKKSKV